MISCFDENENRAQDCGKRLKKSESKNKSQKFGTAGPATKNTPGRKRPARQRVPGCGGRLYGGGPSRFKGDPLSSCGMEKKQPPAWANRKNVAALSPRHTKEGSAGRQMGFRAPKDG